MVGPSLISKAKLTVDDGKIQKETTISVDIPIRFNFRNGKGNNSGINFL